MRRRFGGTSSPQMEPGSAGRCICDGAAQLAAQRADRSKVVPQKGSKSRRRFAFNTHRQRLLGQALQFVQYRLTPLASGLRLLLAGSYLSDKAQPGDIEMLVFLPVHRIGQHIGLLDMFEKDGGKGGIWVDHRVDFYVQLEGLGGNDFALFFQYVGEKTAADKGLDAKDKRGTIEIESWTLP